jgi:hypothetical protein
MTGTEPHQRALREEPYLDALGDVLDWAVDHTVSKVLSCLEAHAGVLYSDGIHRLEDKRFGVFDDLKILDHPLASGTAERMDFPAFAVEPSARGAPNLARVFSDHQIGCWRQFRERVALLGHTCVSQLARVSRGGKG